MIHELEKLLSDTGHDDAQASEVEMDDVDKTLHDSLVIFRGTFLTVALEFTNKG